MRLFFPFLLIISFGQLCLSKPVFPASEVYEVGSDESFELNERGESSVLNDLFDDFNSRFSKRDALSDRIVALLQALNQSGIIIDVLHEIADSPDQMNTLANYIFKALVSISTNNPIEGLNVTVNVTELISQVTSSGIIESTGLELFFDESQRNQFADNLGEILVNYTWIPALIYNTGHTGKFTWEKAFDIARNTKSKDPGFNGTSYTYKSRLSKRDDSSGNYNGTFQTFINNLVGSALGSDLFSESFESILEAVKESGVIVPTVQHVLGDSKILKMVGFILNKLYNYGVFDQIPINDYFQKAKKERIVANGIQDAFTNDIGSEIFGRLFLRWKTRGVYEQIRRNLWGP